ncbi:MAG: CPBP family intramembrane metalloprotease [Planctomycetaceae bacterium]|nr:CPBP family intramembrane metalloprotease [Planctomycetaceae bacterium]
MNSENDSVPTPLPLTSPADNAQTEFSAQEIWQSGIGTGQPPVRDGVVVANPVSPAFRDPWAVPSQVFSWIVIIFCTGLMMGLVFFGQFIEPEESSDSAAVLVPANFTGQFALGAEPFDRGQAKEMLSGLDSGPVPQRLARLVILAELADEHPAPEDAAGDPTGTSAKKPDKLDGPAVLQEFERLREQMAEANYEPTASERELLAATEEVVRAKLDGSPLPNDHPSVEKVESELGFAGRVAAAWSSEDPNASKKLQENSTAKLFFVMFFGLAVLAAVGLGVFVAMALGGGWLLGWLRSGWSSGSGYGFIHLEAFAVWFASFFVCQIVVGLVASLAGLGEKSSIWLTLVIFYVPALVALTWLLVRHPHPRLAWREAGFTSRHGILVDLGKAIATHLAFLPLLALMMFLTVVLTSLVHGGAAAENPFSPPGGPGHPIQEQFDGQWGTVFMLFLLAAVTAPLVEETVFRGLMYRYLRDVTHRYPVVLSVAIATLLNGFIFASIHPQGLLGIPPLMTLAASMSVAREWSGGLLAPMAIHALNNGALVGLMSLMFSS